MDKIGGKGLFIKELEYQLLANTADIAVHSLKDLPANLAPEFQLAAILPRENPFDALVSNHYSSLSEIPNGCSIGTSSARRMAVLKQYYPQLSVKLLRGNLQTRLAKLDAGDYDAIILAVAGLKRLGLEHRISEVLSEEQFIPSIGQGVLAVEISAARAELQALLLPLHDQISAALVGAEREMGKYLQASCNIPIAGYAKLIAGRIHLRALIADKENDIYLSAHSDGLIEDYLSIGQECAEQLLLQGAQEIITRLSHN